MLYIVTLCIVLLTGTVLAATGTWSVYKKLTLDGPNGQAHTSNIKKISSADNTYQVVAKDKTMWTSPEVWLLGQKDDVYSKHLFIRNLNVTYTGGGNTGKAGNYYYLAVIAGYGQMGVDTITLKFNPK